MRYRTPLVVTLLTATWANAAPTVVERAASGSNTVIVQMFEWSWDSIAAECTNFLGPAGYGFVQVSPPQEHVTGTQWWTDYQPVSYILTSKRGNRSQFANMVSVCHKAGVKVIVDTILNHMAGGNSGSGTAGSSYAHYDYPGIYQTQDFHHCGLEPEDQIVDYNNPVEVQTCELVHLADLATNTEYVRAKLASYVNDLLSLGVDGFRLDASKHIPSADISNILSRLNAKPYITQEVSSSDTEAVTPNMYTANGDVQDFRYTRTLRDTFLSSSISGLQNLDNRGWVSGSGANAFVANHDTERTGDSLNYKSANNAYTLAMVFSLAHPYGTISILSGYSFSDIDAGPPNSGMGTCTGTGGSNGWLCQHRWPAVSGMVGFRNHVGASSVITNWVSPALSRIAFGRGTLGFVAINAGDSAWTTSFSTSLPSGSYCDVVNGARTNSGSCSGVSYTVGDFGLFTATIPAHSAIAIHTGATGSGSGFATVNFAPTVTTVNGETVYVTGNLEQLGGWEPLISLSTSSYPKWKATVNLPTNTAFQYKYLKKKSDGTFTWESDPNRSGNTPSSGSITLNDTWH